MMAVAASKAAANPRHHQKRMQTARQLFEP
jgi:hypothetical protein